MKRSDFFTNVTDKVREKCETTELDDDKIYVGDTGS